MAANGRLTIAVHALTWMALVADRGRAVVTAEQIAASINTHPVVVRRTLTVLRSAGIVEGRRGPGAGWSLTRPAESITLADVWDSLGAEEPFGLHHSRPSQDCPVGRGIGPVLTQTYAGVRAAMHEALAGQTIADLLREVLARR
jgi:Rrf2 family protein